LENKQILCGIDIGTTKIAVVIAEWLKLEESINILGVGEAPSKGLKKGIVVNMNQTVDSLTKALSEAEKQADIEVEGAFVGITGDHIKGINYSGVITVSKGSNRQPIGQEITQDDIQRVLDHAQSINLSPDRRILHVLSRDFKVDDRSGIKNPLGLAGHRLEAKVHLVTSAINVEKDLHTCIEKAGVDVIDFVLEPLASAHSVLDDNERKLGVILVDIGGGTTDVIVYHEDGVLHAGTVPLGGTNITYDIAYGVQTTLEQAEQLKCEYGSAKSALADPEENININGTNGRDAKILSRKNLASIIEPRMDEILRLVKNEIRKSDFPGEYTFGIVLTGGGSRLDHVIDLAQEIFQQPIKVGAPKLTGGVSEKVNNPRYSTSVGLINYGRQNWAELEWDIPLNINSIFKRSLSKVGDFFKNWY
jgi:cell division protein FtsA